MAPWPAEFFVSIFHFITHIDISEIVGLDYEIRFGYMYHRVFAQFQWSFIDLKLA